MDTAVPSRKHALPARPESLNPSPLFMISQPLFARRLINNPFTLHRHAYLGIDWFIYILFFSIYTKTYETLAIDHNRVT